MAQESGEEVVEERWLRGLRVAITCVSRTALILAAESRLTELVSLRVPRAHADAIGDADALARHVDIGVGTKIS